MHSWASSSCRIMLLQAHKFHAFLYVPPRWLRTEWTTWVCWECRTLRIWLVVRAYCRQPWAQVISAVELHHLASIEAIVLQLYDLLTIERWFTGCAWGSRFRRRYLATWIMSASWAEDYEKMTDPYIWSNIMQILIAWYALAENWAELSERW